jgi:hypothetical protein
MKRLPILWTFLCRPTVANKITPFHGGCSEPTFREVSVISADASGMYPDAPGVLADVRRHRENPVQNRKDRFMIHISEKTEKMIDAYKTYNAKEE